MEFSDEVCIPLRIRSKIEHLTMREQELSCTNIARPLNCAIECVVVANCVVKIRYKGLVTSE